MSPPCEQSDDGASLAPRDLDARRARSFSRYATCSASSCSRVGSGFGLSASGPVVAAPALQGRDARDPVPGHGLRLGQTVLDVVARRGDLRLPVAASAAAASHDRLLAVGPVQPDPVSRGIHRYGKPAGKRVLAGSGLDELQRLAPEPVVVTSPSILTHTKEPHLRSSNLNFFSPTIGVRFIFTPGPSHTHTLSAFSGFLRSLGGGDPLVKQRRGLAGVDGLLRDGVGGFEPVSQACVARHQMTVGDDCGSGVQQRWYGTTHPCLRRSLVPAAR